MAGAPVRTPGRPETATPSVPSTVPRTSAMPAASNDSCGVPVPPGCSTNRAPVKPSRLTPRLPHSPSWSAKLRACGTGSARVRGLLARASPGTVVNVTSLPAPALSGQVRTVGGAAVQPPSQPGWPELPCAYTQSMPELPEVEALASFLRERASRHTVAHAYVAAISVLKTYDPSPDSLTGLVVGDVTRHGKFLDLSLAPAGGGPADTGHLIVHPARAGWLRWREEIPAAPPKPGKAPLAFRVILDDESGFDLTEAGTKKRLGGYLVRDPMDVPGVASLGPDPRDTAFTARSLAELLAGRRSQIKGVLRDPHIIAGIGNAYSDQVLHVAKMSPFKMATSLTPEQVTELYEAIHTTLRALSKRASGLAAGDLKAEKKTGLRVHGKTGQECPGCGGTIREGSFAYAPLQSCAPCQTGGKPLADRRLSRLLK